MSGVRSTTVDLAESLRGVPIPFAGKVSRLPIRALLCNGATPSRSVYPELHEVMYIEELCDLSSSATVTMTDTSEIAASDSVEGDGIPTGTTVVSVDDSTTITLSHAATITQNNVPLHFYAWGNGDGSTTFDLPDLRGAFLRGAGTGTIDTRDKVGPAVGAYQEDEMQGHRHELYHATGTAGATNILVRRTDGSSGALADWVRELVTDTVNGTPRTGTETRPYAAGVLWCIKT